MEAAKVSKAEDLFHELVERSVDEQRALLEHRCAGDPELRAFVLTLLRNDGAGMKGFLQTPAVGSAWGYGEPGAAHEPLPRRVGRYTVVRRISEGGMGVVFEATQHKPNRTVALKLIKPGAASRGLLRRFQHEVDVLGQLQHTGIACIHEAGIADVEYADRRIPGQPFFAMELVRGTSLTQFVKDNRSATRNRLELFARICDAVHHAHQKGVIHRDLKPANILVQTDGQPKVLDFGVARLTNADLQTVTTHEAGPQLIGTVQYMSPEQVTGDRTQLDTRSDVYALGVVLYELLTGRLPHDLHGRAIPEAARIIRDEEPTRLSSIDTAFRGDLETILGKALEKDKERRYQSAAELAADVRRYLNDEPVAARPPSTAYQFRKFAKRNKGLVGGAAAAVCALLIGLVATTWSMFALAEQRDRALEATGEAHRARAAEARLRIEAEASAELARRETAKARAVSEFLQEMLRAGNPDLAAESELTVRAALDDAATRIQDGAFQQQPEVEAAVRVVLGQTFTSLGRYDDAVPHLETALEIQRRLPEADPAQLADILKILGELRYAQARYEQAQRLFEEALPLFRDAYGPTHDKVAATLNNLAGVAAAVRDFQRAETLLRETIRVRQAVGDEPTPELAVNMSNLAAVLGRAGGDIDEIRELSEKALEINRALLGDEHPIVARALNNIGRVYLKAGNLTAATALFSESVDSLRKSLGSDHPHLATSLNNLADALRQQRRLQEAAEAAAESLAIRRAGLPPRHPHTARSLLLLGLINLERGLAADAEPLLNECVDIRKEAYSPEHHLVAEAKSALGACYTAQERFDEAEKLLLASLPRIIDQRGDDHDRTQQARQRIVALYEAWGKPQQAARFRDPASISTSPATESASQ